ncbi:MAG: hypothetical protein Alpg2KO_02010 [Alphaproteobacteria bacterium]
MSDTLATTGVIEVNGKTFAVGLFWQTAENPDTAKKEAREAALQETDPPENYCVRQGHVTQWGLGGWGGSGHKAGMVCAAPILAEELTGNWLGVFKTPQGWWFASARRDAILPDGDVLYDNEEEPRDRFEMEFGRGGWDRVFTPPEWGIGGDPTELDDLIGATVANEVKLQSVAGFLGPITKSIANPAHRRYWVGSIGALVVGLVLWVGVQALAPIFSGPKVSDVSTPIPPTPKPIPKRDPRDRDWEAKPLPSEWAEACLKTLEQIYFEIPGWSVQKFSCAGGGGTDGTANAQYLRAGSTIDYASRAINNRNRDVRRYLSGGVAENPIFHRFGGEGNLVDLTMSFSKVNDIEPRGQQVLKRRAELEATIWQRFQELAMPVSLQFSKSPPQPTQGEPETPCSVPPAAELGFSAPVDPSEIASVFDSIPGAYFDMAVLNIDNNEWSYVVRVEEATINDDAYETLEGGPDPQYHRENGPDVCKNVF